MVNSGDRKDLVSPPSIGLFVMATVVAIQRTIWCHQPLTA
ncbi:hypothetical protein VS85_00301 [Vibrio cholerae]|nr:hypothetical protein VCD_002484 [Vibrio cholerae MJ-1236]EEO08538.1 hypothetical protein VCC_002901 [Vibrio cholerae RC9]EEO16642.1 hypothetical protein VCE_003145 [Vibrio cholerae B33]EEO20451.1 hypothetical protein VCF_003259 [Vibrio cholerae BX 330286]KKP18462.1 hypothetical protein VS85_00301 [Vibrio cholerae]